MEKEISGRGTNLAPLFKSIRELEKAAIGIDVEKKVSWMIRVEIGLYWRCLVIVGKSTADSIQRQMLLVKVVLKSENTVIIYCNSKITSIFLSISHIIFLFDFIKKLINFMFLTIFFVYFNNFGLHVFISYIIWKLH